MKQADTLTDFVKYAASVQGEKQVLISQQESTSPDTILGDEDSGKAIIHVTLTLLLESSEGAMSFSQTYDNTVRYEEAIEQVGKLEENISSKTIEPEEMDKRLKEN